MRQGAGRGTRVGKHIEEAGVGKLRPVWGRWQFCLDAAGRQAGPWQVCPGCRTYLRQRTAIRRPVSAIRSCSLEMRTFLYQQSVQPMRLLSDLSETQDGNSEAGVGNSVLCSGNV